MPTLIGLTRKEDARSRGLVRALIAILAVVAIPIALASCGVIAYLVFVVSDDVEMPDREALAYRTFTLEPNLLPDGPSDRDWYDAAVTLLRESGWDLDPDLTSLGTVVPCRPDPSLEIDRITLFFIDTYHVGLLPSVKRATVVIDRSLGSADVHISYKVWETVRLRPTDFRSAGISMRQALAIADEHGGREFREAHEDVCDAGVYLWGNRWRVSYRADTRSGWERWWIWVDAETGEAWRDGYH